MHKKSFLLLSLISLMLVLSFSTSGKAFALTPLIPFTHDLHYGMTNSDEVKNLQNLLITKQMYSGPINGNYYSKTRKAVKALQQQLGVEGATGYFGEKTRILVNQAIIENVSPTTSTASAQEIIDPLNSTTTQFDTSSTSPGTDISNVASTTVKLSTRIDELSSQVSGIEDSINSLSSSIDTINSQIVILQGLMMASSNPNSQTTTQVTPVTISPVNHVTVSTNTPVISKSTSTTPSVVLNKATTIVNRYTK